jgi:hypothetical protein
MSDEQIERLRESVRREQLLVAAIKDAARIGDKDLVWSLVQTMVTEEKQFYDTVGEVSA